jgi:hypothetical protein
MDTLGLIGGSATLVLLVALGIYLYPMLLKRRGGWLMIAGCTVVLTVVFYLFDRGGFEPPAVWLSAGLALLWALAPLVAALIVRRVDRKTRYP